VKSVSIYLQRTLLQYGKLDLCGFLDHPAIYGARAPLYVPLFYSSIYIKKEKNNFAREAQFEKG